MLAYIETYGCAFAQAESEIIAGMLAKHGFAIVSSPDVADVLIIVTCHVKEATENKVIYRIRELCRKYPKKPLLVYGCLPRAYPEKVRKACERASLVGNFNLREIPKAVKQALQGERVELLSEIPESKLGLPRIKRNPVIGIVPIAEGCLCSCAYCSTKLSRGEIFSFSPEEIVKEIKHLLKTGCKEIWLTAQDCACYGFDIGTNLAELLQKICKLSQKFFVRVGMLNPLHVKKILPELLQAYENEKIYKFLHLPVQSGSNKILYAMHRRYNVSDFLGVIKTFRERFPFLQLWTDIIVGFPGETEKDFEATKKLLLDIKPDWVNVSKFSVRERTEAAKLKQISTKIKKQRSRELSEIVRELGKKANEKWVGWCGEALVDEKGKYGYVARNFAYKPIVLKADENLLGKFLKVKVVKAESFLFGEILKISSINYRNINKSNPMLSVTALDQ